MLSIFYLQNGCFCKITVMLKLLGQKKVVFIVQALLIYLVRVEMSEKNISVNMP